MSTSAALGLDNDRSSGQDGVVLFGAVGRDHFGHTLVSIANQQSAVDTTGLSLSLSLYIYINGLQKEYSVLTSVAGVVVLESAPTAVCMCLSGKEDRAFVSTYGATAAVTVADLDLPLLRSCTHVVRQPLTAHAHAHAPPHIGN
jgi:sugar/nucleoside kinase (ribokinase family)